MKIGMDSYVNILEADEYINKMFAIDSVREYWLALEDNQKESLLLESMVELETVPVVGYRQNFEQTLQFPRAGDNVRLQDRNTIPKEVKYAQIENAISILGERLGLTKDGNILHSKKSEQLLRKWTGSAFKSGGWRC